MFDSERDQEDLTLEGLLGLSLDAPSESDGARPPAEAPRSTFSLEEALGLGGVPDGGEGKDGLPARSEAERPGAAAGEGGDDDDGADLLSRLIFGSASQGDAPARADSAPTEPSRAAREGSAAAPAATLASLLGVLGDGRSGHEEAPPDNAETESPFDLMRAFGVEGDGGRDQREAGGARARETRPATLFDLSSALGVAPDAPPSGRPAARTIRSRFADLPSSSPSKVAGGRNAQSSAQPAKSGEQAAAYRAGAAAGPLAPVSAAKDGTRASEKPSAQPESRDAAPSASQASTRAPARQAARAAAQRGTQPTAQTAQEPTAQPVPHAPSGSGSGSAANPARGKPIAASGAAGSPAGQGRACKEAAVSARFPVGGGASGGAAAQVPAEAGKGVGEPAPAGATAPVPPAISVPRHRPMTDFSKLLPAKASQAPAEVPLPAAAADEPDAGTRAAGSSCPGECAAGNDAAAGSATPSCDGELRTAAKEGRGASPAATASQPAAEASRSAAEPAASSAPEAPPSAPGDDRGAPRRGLMLAGSALLAGAALVGALAIGVSIEGGEALQHEGSPLSLWEEATGGKLHPSTIEYRYTVKAADGTLGKARETASFDAEGMLAESRITVALADDAQAERFLEEARAAFGDSLAYGRTSGAEASLTVVAQGEPVDSDTYTELLRRDTIDCEVVGSR